MIVLFILQIISCVKHCHDVIDLSTANGTFALAFCHEMPGTVCTQTKVATGLFENEEREKAKYPVELQKNQRRFEKSSQNSMNTHRHCHCAPFSPADDAAVVWIRIVIAAVVKWSCGGVASRLSDALVDGLEHGFLLATALLLSPVQIQATTYKPRSDCSEKYCKASKPPRGGPQTAGQTKGERLVLVHSRFQTTKFARTQRRR